MSGFLAMVGLIYFFTSRVAAPENDFTTLKYLFLRDWFKLRLVTFQIIESPTIAAVYF